MQAIGWRKQVTRRVRRAACAGMIQALVAAVLVCGPVGDRASSQPPSQDQVWICPPCGNPCDAQAHAQPGRCPGCRMALIPKGSLRKVAILLFPGVELLDFAGPGEVFSATGAFDLFTVGATTDPVVSQGFVTITPQHSIETCPQPDILVVPGGGVVNVTRDTAFMDWIQRSAATAQQVLSVCNGAIILAKAGLLDGLEATTHQSAIAALRRAAPRATVHEDRRYVDNGKVVTAAGVSSGIDMALHVVSRLLSPESARLAAEYMEYRWQPEP